MLKVPRKELLSKLENAARVAPSRSPKEILRWVRLTHDGQTLLTITATDSEVGLRQTMACDGKPCDFLLPAQHAASVIKEWIAEELTIDPSGPQTVISCGRNDKFRFNQRTPSEFPTWEHKGEEVSLPAGSFAAPYKRIKFAVAEVSTNYANGGVLLDMTGGSYLVACDGNVVGIEKISDLTANWSGILTPKFLDAARCLVGDIRVSLGKASIEATDGHSVVYGRLIQGMFHKWRNLSPETHGGHVAKFNVTIGELVRITRQALLATDVESIRAKLGVSSQGELSIATGSADRGNASITFPIACDADGQSEVNCQYLASVFSGLDPNDDVQWGFGPMHEFTVGNWRALLMEMQSDG